MVARVIGWLGVIAAICAPALAEDTVIVSSRANPRARTKIIGRIVDYTGTEIVVELPGGGQKKAPGDQVVEIQSTWSADHAAGDSLFAQRQYLAALGKYIAAGKKEDRAWVRRKILAHMVICAREQRQWSEAGEYFLSIVKSDPATPYFPVIPLAWTPGELPLGLEQKAAQWLDKGDTSMAALLGASHLLKTSREQTALGRLERLAADSDKRIASLAEAQIWRGTFATATPEKVLAWNDRIERFPEPLLAGPYLVLGRALAYRKQPELAAMALMHVPIEFPEERTLAAEALVSAGGALEQLGQKDDAGRLYREVVTNYPETRTVTDAKAKLESN